MTQQHILRRALVLALIVFLIAPFGQLRAEDATTTAQQGQFIRVGIAWSKSSLAVSAPGGFSVLDEATGQLVIQSTTAATFTPSQGGVAIANYGRCNGPLVLTAAAGDNYLTYSDGRKYRGTLRVVNEGGKLTLINVVTMDEYLFGVVPREMGGTWPLEALKAQAVASRTYALASTGKYGSYDVRATTDSQVYGGLNDEKAASNEAVLATSGTVATYNGQLISAFFYSSSGGYTESNEYVWSVNKPSPYPWTRAVSDPFDKDNKWSHWRLELSLADAQKLLAAAGHDVGTLESITPQDPTASGRWVHVTFRGSSGSETMSSNDFRIAIGAYTLPSTRFTMVQHADGMTDFTQYYPMSATPTIAGSGGQVTASLSGLTVIGADGTATLGASGQTEVAVAGKQWAPAGFTFVGSGWGHGVGMSQWGAYGMATQGYNYQDILKHYYTGIEIVNTQPTVAANEPQQ